MNYYLLLKPFLLATLFIKEQLKEPIALFWIVISPVGTFYLITFARTSNGEVPDNYLNSTSWFYAFVSSSVAMFGLAFYIVGRRESGFLRSFVYTARTKIIFLAGQFLAYSVMSVIYCSVFMCLLGIILATWIFSSFLIWLVDSIYRFCCFPFPHFCSRWCPSVFKIRILFFL